MKITVKIDGQTFEVEVGDVNARPVIAKIEGETFEVFVEADEPTNIVTAPLANPASPSVTPHPNGNSHIVRAPLPGVVISIAVQSGTAVTLGQELCVIEAMKMKNAIRANRAGIVAAVHITPGQHIKHHEMLMEFSQE